MNPGAGSRRPSRPSPAPTQRPTPSGPPKRTNTPYLDIPPRTRSVMIVVALMGMTCAVIGSLMAKKGVAIEADKIVHFTGYTLLGCLMILGLRPLLWPLGMLMVAGMSAALELIQPIFGRSCDWGGDFTTNCLAIVAGSCLGMIARFAWSYIRTEMANAEIRKATVGFGDGMSIFRQGEPSDKFYIIRSGQVVLTREANGGTSEIGKAGPGEVVGEMGVLQNLPRSATATAKGRVWLYGMTLADLTDKRSDGQDHPGTVVSRVLAQRLRQSMEKLDKASLDTMNAPLSHGPANPDAPRVSRTGTPSLTTAVKVGLRMGWRSGEQVQWSEKGSEHELPMIFGRSPGPQPPPPGTEVVLVEENPPQRLAPLQFTLAASNGTVILKDEQSPYGTEVSGVSVGPGVGPTEVQLPPGTHVVVAGGEGSPYVLALEIPTTG
jgi:CRP/FNR family transcriptional regulator, cyclic AMP receptor protein